MARAYLSAHDAKMSTRTWVAVMREMGTPWNRIFAGTLRANLVLESL
jgi:hypothetical protein